MIRGIGVDMVSIPEIRRYLEDEKLAGSFVRRTFTKEEVASAEGIPDQAAYYAARFAVKEAVFKALGPLTQKKSFDLRIVESLHREDGSPCVTTTGPLEKILQETEVTTLHLSVTTEEAYALAFVVAESA